MNWQLEDGSPGVMQHEEQRGESEEGPRGRVLMPRVFSMAPQGVPRAVTPGKEVKDLQTRREAAALSLCAGDVVSCVGKPDGHTHSYWRRHQNRRVQDQRVSISALALNSLIKAMIHREILVQFLDCLYVFVLGAVGSTQFPLQLHYSYYKTIPDLSYWEIISNKLTIAIKSQ